MSEKSLSEHISIGRNKARDIQEAHRQQMAQRAEAGIRPDPSFDPTIRGRKPGVYEVKPAHLRAKRKLDQIIGE